MSTATAVSCPPLTVPTTLLEPTHLEGAAQPMDIRIDPVARDGVAECRRFAGECLIDGRPVYGATTGFGALVGFGGGEDPADQGESLLAFLSTGQGPDLDGPVVRAAMLVRLHSLCQGRSGVSPAVVEALAAALRTGFTPAVPRLGSLGASGDLVPLTYVARALRGEGHALVDGSRLPAAEALDRAGLAPVTYEGRDALALVNGTSLTAAAAGLALACLHRSRTSAMVLTALLADVLGCTPGFLDAELLTAYGHPEAVRAGREMRGYLDGLVPSGSRPLQEPYSIRCTPQLIGAVGSTLDHAADVVCHDLNSVSDNPLFFPEHDRVAHGGNFFGQPAAFASDGLSLAATQLGNLAERQLDLLIDPHRNGGLPPMLALSPGRQHALTGLQITATAIVAQMRRTAVPASVQSLPTNGHNQDVIPLGTHAALNALDHARALRLLHGSLAVALRQAVYVGGRRPTAAVCAGLFDRLAETVAPVDPDRPLDEDVRRAADVLGTSAEQLAHAMPPAPRRQP